MNKSPVVTAQMNLHFHKCPSCDKEFSCTLVECSMYENESRECSSCFVERKREQ